VRVLPRRKLRLCEIALWIVPAAICMAGLRRPLVETGIPVVSFFGLLVILGYVTTLYVAREISPIAIWQLSILTVVLVVSAIVSRIIESIYAG
jgi:VIT1/CCC1 family predicted Fe2+/Mn2+ transporter